MTRPAAMKVLTILGGVVVALSAGELWVRMSPPRPVTQIVRDNRLRLLDGVPVWGDPASEVSHVRCVEEHPERTRLLFIGDSITVGGVESLHPDEIFTRLLEDRLNAARPKPGFCVLNFAQCGFHYDQKLALLKEMVPRYKPALVFWEDWSPEWVRYTMLGDAAYATEGIYQLPPDGFPKLAGVPAPLNRWAFLHSQLYEYLDLALAPRIPTGNQNDLMSAFFVKNIPPVASLVRANGGRLALYVGAWLDHPFKERSGEAEALEKAARLGASAAGVPVYPLADLLADQDYQQVRIDSCCHYNPAGQRALAAAFEPIALQQLDRPH